MRALMEISTGRYVDHMLVNVCRRERAG